MSDQSHTLASFPLGRESSRYTSNRMLVGPPSRSGRFGEQRNLYTLPGFEPRIVQSVVSWLSTTLSKFPSLLTIRILNVISLVSDKPKSLRGGGVFTNKVPQTYILHKTESGLESNGVWHSHCNVPTDCCWTVRAVTIGGRGAVAAFRDDWFLHAWVTSRQGISRSRVQGEMLVTGLQAWDEDVQQSSENWFTGHRPSTRQVV